MEDFKTSVLRSIVHVLEVAVIGGIVLGIMFFFKGDQEIHMAFKEIVLAVLATAGGTIIPKFFRTWSGTPSVPDYVNGEKY